MLHKTIPQNDFHFFQRIVQANSFHYGRFTRCGITGSVAWGISKCKISQMFNSLAPGKFEWHLRYLIFQIISVIDGWGISCELALRWMSLNLTDDKSTLVQVMAWCRQATSHYLSQWRPRSLSSYGFTRPQWSFYWLDPSDAIWWHTSGLMLAQVMACCLMAPSHYLKILTDHQRCSVAFIGSNFARSAHKLNP